MRPIASDPVPELMPHPIAPTSTDAAIAKWTGTAPGVDRPAVGWSGAVQRRLRVLAGMCDGWDHAGAARPHPSAVDRAEQLLDRLASAPQVVPEPTVGATRGGAVQIEWENQHRYFEIEVAEEGAVTLLFQDDGTDREWAVPLDGPLDELVEYVGRVYG